MSNDKRFETEREKANLLLADSKKEMIENMLRNFDCNDISDTTCCTKCPLKRFCDLVN